MSSRNIFTNIFRGGYPHLDQPWSANAQQEPKYGIAMMFPKVGTLPAHINTSIATGVDNIIQALNEVCMEEWGVGFDTAPQVRGIQFPPQWKDGDADFKKDERGNFTAEINPASAGMWILGVKSKDPVGIVDHTGDNELLPSAVYAGCWCRAELEISAYVNKAGSSIISIQLLNIQKCYDDESLGGATPRRAATTAFGGMVVEGSNCQVGVGQVGMGAVPAATPQAPQAPQAPQGGMPGQVAPAGMPGQVAPAGMPGQVAPAAPAGMAPQAPQGGMPGQVAPAAPAGMPGQVAPAGMAPQAPQGGMPGQVAPAGMAPQAPQGGMPGQVAPAAPAGMPGQVAPAAPAGMAPQAPQGGMAPQAAPAGMPGQVAPAGMPGQVPGQVAPVNNPYLNPAS